MSEAARGFTVRAPHEDDVDAVVEVMNACSVDDIGVEDTEPADVFRWWHRDDFDLSRDAWIAETPDGRAVGCSAVALDRPEGDILLDGYTHPGFVGQGIGSRLADLGERRAAEIAVERRRALPVELFHGAWAGSMPARFLAQRGYDLTRSFIRMRIELDGPPPDPVWPAGVRVEGFEQGRDEPLFHEADEDAFLDHWRSSPTPYEDWVRDNVELAPSFDGSLWFRAMDGDEVAGLIIGRSRASEDPDAAYVATLGVRRPWRRKGIGLALLRHEFGVLYRRGVRAVVLGVDADSPTDATRLYQRAGMREIRRVDVYVKTFG